MGHFDGQCSTSRVNRRTFIVTIASSLLGGPYVSRAQQPAMPMIGFINGGSPGGSAYLVAAFRQGLRETGFIDGQNVGIDVRWTEGHSDRAPATTRELVQLRVALLAVGGGSAVRRAAKDATATIPIVFVTGADPIHEGLVASLGRPTGNITGIAVPTITLNAKRLELLDQLVPRGDTIAVLANPAVSWTDARAREMQMAARAMARRIQVLNASSEREIDVAFTNLATMRASGLLISADPLFSGQLRQLVDLSKRFRIPAIFEWREFATAGGLMSYGSDIANGYREAGVYAGRILNGTKPSELPVLQATKFEFVINLATAKSLGLTIPQSLLFRADDVIQ